MSDDLHDLNGLAASLAAALGALLEESGADCGRSAAGGAGAAGARRARRPHDQCRHGDRKARRETAARARRGAGRALDGRSGRRALRARRSRRPGLPQPLPQRRLVPRRPRAHARGGRRLRPRLAAGGAADQGQRRVRQREPHGPAARGPRALRVVRRRALPHLRLRRPRRDPRVLRERLRHADGPLRAVAGGALRPAPRARRRGPRRRLPGRVPAGARRRAHRRSRRQVPRRGRRCGARHDGAAAGRRDRLQDLGARRHPRPVPRHARAPARALRRLDAREQRSSRARASIAGSKARSARRSRTSTARTCSTTRTAPCG